MKSPDDVIEILKRKFKNKHKEWLKETISNDSLNSWPLEINLGIPTEQEALKHPECVRSWISAWNKWQSNTINNNTENKDTLVWSERRWRSLGTQSVPEKLIIASVKEATTWIGEGARWLRATERFKLMIQRWSALINVLTRHFNVLADYNDSDFNSLCEILSWICNNPNSNLYIRQIPIAGIDSKWLESRKGLVAELIAAIKGGTSERCITSSDISDTDEATAKQEISSRDFYNICDIKPLPQIIRMRILEPKLRKMFGGLGDISAPLEEIADLDFTVPAPPHTVFIIENVQTALAFGNLENSTVLFGLGYGVDVLGKLPWLEQARCIYWGDIDTHGFAILNRARSYLPKLESILMDEATLLNHRQLWVSEKDQAASAELSNLSADEQKLYQALKSNAHGQSVRLEQERIRWDYAWSVLETLV
ncbi:MAG: DUF2220 family protein [Treponema sp.]|nr:DUF2220 family protein [Treponema sp.]MCL2237496.1 DUF2220 family protein [Treponema sp.]